MGSGVDSYLHKKFKKQLSIEPRAPQNHDKENKVSYKVLEPCEEKRTHENGTATGECHTADSGRHRTDNNESVPNDSTNQNSIYLMNSSLGNMSKSSSISTRDPCISYRVPNQANEEQCESLPVPEPTTVRTSSTYDRVFTKPDDISVSANETYQSKDEDVKQDEVQPPPDRNSSGKYVCNYCNLVCSKPSVLQKHIRAHTNERPYPCHSCGFSFKTRSNLYKHCRSRTHANRVMGNKAQENTEGESSKVHNVDSERMEGTQDLKSKPYKPRFHSGKQFFDNVAKENIEDDKPEPAQYRANDFVSYRINELISKNNSIMNSGNPGMFKKRVVSEVSADHTNNNEHSQRYRDYETYEQRNSDEPLNLSNKNRKRSMSEVAEPTAQKSLIKELLLKNVYSNHNMQCQYCKMIFQTVTELELHEFRSCKGKPSGAKYTRSSSVNVASILTQNKNAFDTIPQLANTTFPLNSPGPFLGKTRLVESDKSKSFSFDDGLRTLSGDLSNNYFPFEKKMPVKLFGGEVKIAHNSNETKKFKIDNKDERFGSSGTRNFSDYDGKMSENRVIKFSLQSGGTVLTNKPKSEVRPNQENSRNHLNYDNMSITPTLDLRNLTKPNITFEKPFDSKPVLDEPTNLRINELQTADSPKLQSPNVYPNIMDFSQKAVKLLTPNIKQPSIIVTAGAPKAKFYIEDNGEVKESRNFNVSEPEVDLTTPSNLTVDRSPSIIRRVPVPEPQISPNSACNPMKLLVNGKVIRYVPGMPGPVVAEEPMDVSYGGRILVTNPRMSPKPSPIAKTFPEPMDTSETPSEMSPIRSTLFHRIMRADKQVKPEGMETLEITVDVTPERRSPSKVSEFKSPVKSTELKSPHGLSENKKFARPNSLALKPTAASLKQHHGLTPTNFNKILISPDTPRINKKYAHHFLHGNYFSYLDLKSSTKPVYCTLNKTQPFYVPHFKKLSMYSEWRQLDMKQDKLYVSAYDSSQRSHRYSMAGSTPDIMITTSTYKFMVSEIPSGKIEKEEQSKVNHISGGYESNEDYTYIRGRGRGRYVCEQCGIRCKKPSMLKKHIRTHSVDRPYTCNHCNFSFKTKGNLTKHMKSKAHTKNYSASSSSSSSTHQSGTQSSDSDTDDSGMDSSDESTRQQEHEAAYGLLSLSQKTTQNITHVQHDSIVNSSSISNRSAPSPMSSVGVPENYMNHEEPTYMPQKNNTGMVYPESDPYESMETTNMYPDPPMQPQQQQVKLEKNLLAKSVASEYLKLATKNENNPDGGIEANSFGPINKDVNDLIVKPEGNKNCTICSKSFSKPSQLKLHMNIHYLERPFRCDSCSVSFRTKGHLQKHERSASHHNKLSSSPALSSSEPRPFKCSDCNIAFRIHGHLAKHLRSKMHIMKLECLAKIPFGLYAELERFNCLLTEINTCDGDQCLESLKTLAKKVFVNDPNKLNQIDTTEKMDADT
ncbi:uncharacterized protein LOC109605695 isoform X2 [Aethina tumida]|uniref:uncharacterized protein LOC109605695 isoform X2 n=1 Tax=Aethina tumida TaxID=116153 RepID=UPI002149061C|nr:uncharacterized protein LOC109605695 isoform X2 [Aethina tumida]